MRKTICILTATRAEYGLLKLLIKKLLKEKEFDVKVVVTGAHLSPEFGLTYKQIEQDGILIDEKIEMLLSSDTPSAINKSMGLALIGFADYFNRTQPDLLIVLGDRYETLAVATAAMVQRIPIAHLHGGETTQGAIDECIRHAITKMSYLHFTSTNVYRDRVIQLGEQPNKVFNVGATGVENIINGEFLSKCELEESIGIRLDKPYIILTFHPVTLEDNTSVIQLNALLEVCDMHDDKIFIFTKANADTDGRIINKRLEEYCTIKDNSFLFASLGIKRYLSAMKYCKMVVGNSSSGIVEAPSFNVPTVNIGDRQKGRIQADTIINCEPTVDEIKKAFEKALSDDFNKIATNAKNPYGDGNTTSKIVEIIKKEFLQSIDLKKVFYNVEVSIE